MGNTGASALVKSAASTASAIADYNDKVRAFEWENSAQTDDEYQAYSKYLNDRADKLSKVGTLASSSKLISVMSTARGVTRSYISNSLQRTSQAIMNGNANGYTKLEQIRTLYGQAVNSGDMNLAQNLYSQYQSLDQQIQYQEAQAAIANEALYEKNQKAIKAGYDSSINAIEQSVNTLSSVIKSGGQATLTDVQKEESKKAIQTLKEQGVDVSQAEGKAFNNGSLVSGALVALAELNSMAADAIRPVDPETAVKYDNTVEAIVNNRIDEGSINILGARFTKEMADEWSNIPMLYHTDMDENGNISMVKSQISAWTYDQNGKPTPIINESDMNVATTEWAGEEGKSAREQAMKELSDLGFSIENVNDKSGTFNVKVSDTSNQMIKDYIELSGMSKSNTEFQVRKFGDGFQLYSGYTDKTGNKPLVYISKDANKNYGLSTGKFNQLTGITEFAHLGETSPNFNRLNNSLTSLLPDRTAISAIQKALTNYDQMPQGYIQNTLIPDIARRFYNGNISKATEDVNKYAAPTVASGGKPTPVTSNTFAQTLWTPSQNPVAPAVAKVPGLPEKKPLSYAEITSPFVAKPTTKPIAGGTLSSSLNINASPFVSPTQLNANQAIANAFVGYSSKPKYYTEDVIIKDIAKNYFGNDTKAAAQVVYKYRQEHFNEGYGSM